MGTVLQPQATAPGDWRSVSCGIGTFESRPSCERRWKKGSRTMFWRWPYGKAAGTVLHVGEWKGSRWCYGRKGEAAFNGDMRKVVKAGDVYEVTAQGEKDPFREAIEREETGGKDREVEGGEGQGWKTRRGGRSRGIRRKEMPGGVIGVDGEAQAGRNLSGDGGGWTALNQWQARAMEGCYWPCSLGFPMEKRSGVEPSSCSMLERKSKAGTGWSGG